MLHEILLSLAGHPSPILDGADHDQPSAIFAPAERALLARISRLSNLHQKLGSSTKTITAEHSSSVGQAVASFIRFTVLGRFQQKVLEVEDGILRNDAGSVGAYNIVPLTMIVGQFSQWTRRMEWLDGLVHFIRSNNCSSTELIEELSSSMSTGYDEIEQLARELLVVAENAWLKQLSVWLLYGRLPAFGCDDFIVSRHSHEGNGVREEYILRLDALPYFISPSTAASILFIGRSLNQINPRNDSFTPLSLVRSHMEILSDISLPITAMSFARHITTMRQSLSQKALRHVLPLDKIRELLLILHDYFLLGSGDFAAALIQEADEKMSHRWQKSYSMAHTKRDRLDHLTVKESEIAAVLTRTWAALSMLGGTDAGSEKVAEMAKDLIQLIPSKKSPSARPSTSHGLKNVKRLAETPFGTFLLGAPSALTLRISSPFDLFLTSSDVYTYSIASSYLLAIRRANLRLSGLWRVASLRRHHPAPPAPSYGSGKKVRGKLSMLRDRVVNRDRFLRKIWTTSSATLFLLGAIEAYVHEEVIQAIWKDFTHWLQEPPSEPIGSSSLGEDDIWVSAGDVSKMSPPSEQEHDPEALSEAHRRCMDSLVAQILLTAPTFTNALYDLLQHIDLLVALVLRLQAIWTSLDLEADEGLVDAFSDFGKEERDVKGQLVDAAENIKGSVQNVVNRLHEINQDDQHLESLLGEASLNEDEYVPARPIRLDRLLSKLDFGVWLNVDAARDADSLEQDAM